jgi:hypothetical protein
MTAQPIPPAIAQIAPDGNLTPRQMRHFLIQMSLRRQRPGTGSSLTHLQERTAMHPWPDLRAILNGLRWAIIGGVATRAYMPERMTKDLDILVHHADANEAIRRLQQNEFAIVSRLAVPGFLMRSATEVEVDVLIGQQPWLNKALSQVQLDPAGYPVLGLPYLVLMKLAAMRAQDWADISRMLGLASDEALNAVRAVVARYAPEDRDDLESLIFIGQKEREIPPGD